MKFLQKIPIKGKLVSLMVITGAAVALIITLLLLVNESTDQRRIIGQQLTTLAKLIGENSIAALAFEDDAAANENLAALHATPNIVFAFINSANDEAFAAYVRADKQDVSRNQLLVNSVPLDNAGLIPRGNLVHSQPLTLDGDTLGTLTIASDLTAFYNELYRYLIVMGVILLGSIGVSFLISNWLHSVISAPVHSLRQAMTKVREDKDYSVRAISVGDDEITRLSEGFNDMLEQIQARDAELEKYSMTLQDRIEKRTQELDDANQKRISWLETLAGFLRHELKNTIIGFKTTLDLIERKVESDVLPTYVSRARGSIVFMSKLLESVGEASSLEATLYSEDKTRTNLTELVKRRAEEYASVYEVTPINVSCSGHTEVLANDIRLMQLLDKLVSNAVEHADAGTGVEILVTEDDYNVVLSVKNQGEELPEDVSSLFELFVSKRSEKVKEKDNLGLGLYVVRIIAESLGGKVDARPLENAKGAEFVVTLPQLERDNVVDFLSVAGGG